MQNEIADFLENRMCARPVPPVARIGKIGFAAVNNGVPETAGRGFDILHDGMRAVQVVVSEEQSGAAVFDHLAAFSLE